uniref:Small terminase n=1 Tax=uncultured marine virus TaxID=186617 RepID=A0A0F7L4Q4_9VIRU|nr:small terminase [uncultured marine virus]
MAAPKGNKYALGLTNSGRPLKWKSVDEFKKVSDGFFDWCSDNDFIPDIEGLCLYLGTHRKVLCDYEKKEEFSNAIKEIKEGIFFHKKQLAMKGNMNATVFIFDAKNNHDMVDKQEVDNKNLHKFEGDPFEQIRKNTGIDTNRETKEST